MKNGTPPKQRAAKNRRLQVEPSSGNVFADLDVPQPEEFLAKAQLAQRICALLAARKLTQARAAEILDIDQPKISALVRGRLDGFSIDRLFRFLNALGQDVEIMIRRHGNSRGAPTTRVVTT